MPRQPPLPTVYIDPASDLDCGIRWAIAATGEAATGLTSSAWLSEEIDHSTNDPAPELHPSLRVNHTEDPSEPGHYEGAIDGSLIDDHVIEANPPFTFGSSRKLYMHWEVSGGRHEWAPCIVRSP